MNRLLIYLLVPSLCAAQARNFPKTKASDAGKAHPPAPAVDEKTAKRQAELLASAIKIGQAWQDIARRGDFAGGMSLWGYSAFDGVKKETLADSLETQRALLGPVKTCQLLADRSLVVLDGTAPGTEGEGRGIYVTLVWLGVFEKGIRREILILHEPAKDGSGLKITGLRSEDLPSGRQAAAELAASLGQLAFLKLRGAPRDRWSPFQHEAAALAERLKITLPPIPDTGETDPKAGEKLAALVMTTAPSLFDTLGLDGGKHDARALLNAFSILMLYEPGDETCTRLAVLAGVEAEKAKLPADIWKPVIQTVSRKQPLDAVHEAIQRMAAGISDHIARQTTASRLQTAPRLIIEQALLHMEQLPSYKAHATLTATDGRTSIMDATLAPGAMYLHYISFDGRKEARLATGQGYHLSHDEGKTWTPDPDHEAAKGLCRTLQVPLDRAKKYPERHTFEFKELERLDGEDLFRFRSQGAGTEAPITYWVLISKNGPVIRRAAMQMTFGTLTAEALLRYTRLGKEVEIPILEDIPPDGK